jgi:hypothetical protein
MSDVEILNSQIFPAGTKFVVTDETTDSTYGPGTTGFVSFVRGFDQDYPNVAFLEVSVIRRGKKGKDRLEFAQISTPIFKADKKEVFPDEKRKNFIHIDIDKDAYTPVAKMGAMDFLGWSTAYVKWLHKLSQMASIKVWPGSSKNVLNRFKMLPDSFYEDPEVTIERFAEDEDVAAEFLNRARLMEATLTKCGLVYMSKVANVEERAIKEMVNSKAINPKIGGPTIGAFCKKRRTLNDLVKNHGNKSKIEKMFEGASVEIM